MFKLVIYIDKQNVFTYHCKSLIFPWYNISLISLYEYFLSVFLPGWIQPRSDGRWELSLFKPWSLILKIYSKSV